MKAFLLIVAVAAAPIAAVALVTRRRQPAPTRARSRPTRFRGLGEATTSCQAVAPGANVRVCLTKPKGPLKVIGSPQDACRLLAAAGQRDRESFYTVAIDIRNQVLGVEEIHKGTVAAVEVHPREVFKSAIAMNAAGILVAHNHPSGDPSPSPEDIALTKRLRNVGDEIGIPVIDHLVIGDRKCVSIAADYPHLFK